MPGLVGDRAIVLGGSIGGTLAARVLAEFYREVVVVDRDTVLGVDTPRRGVPQGGQAHGLHGRGYAILAELFPGLRADLESLTVPTGDLGEVHWYFNGLRTRPAHTGLMSVTAARPVLENHLRTRVAATDGVTYRERTEVVGLCTAPGHARVTGARLRDLDGGDEHELSADLVVDTTGTGSRTTRWLAELGYPRPADEKMAIGLTYTSRTYRTDPGMFDGAQSINPVSSPLTPRGAFFSQTSATECVLSLTGLLGDRPPTDVDGFLEFARSLPIPDVHRAVRDATPTSDPYAFGIAASIRRRFERLARFPLGLVVMGDAVCRLNPIYGQGMGVAAAEALVLREQLARGREVVPREFFAAIGRTLDIPWMISTNSDLDFPGMPGKRPLAVRIGNAYMSRVLRATAADPAATRAFFQVAGMHSAPATMFRPRTVARVLWASRSVTGSARGGPAPGRTRTGAG